MDIKNNINRYKAEVETAGCRLIAVSKTQPTTAIAEAYQAGQRLFGENKAQEMAAKQKELAPDIEWHMIGHLQTNKVKYIAPFVSLIHSVDSARLLEEINRQALKNKRSIPCLLQVHIAREATKFGWDAQELKTFLHTDLPHQFPAVTIIGLMGMATLTDNEDQIESEFRTLKNLFMELQHSELPANVSMKELSMGMSSDYKLALKAGSTLVRIGTSIFGARQSPNH
ncbi:MAG: YggS family pyridoxal phosphate-dependent enzyme [Cyclobacteriaceae bacterium]|nr:YggS family pyridoxal phosphate-dependent enzyme [Cyclobacteriaceae bacterium]